MGAEVEAASSSSSSSSSPASHSSPSQPRSSAWFLIQAFYQLSTWAERPALLSCCRTSPSQEVVQDDFSPLSSVRSHR